MVLKTLKVYTINDYMLEWVVRQAHPFFHFIHLAGSQQILPFMLPKFNISPGNHYPYNWNAFVGVFVMRSTWYTSKQNLFKCAPVREPNRNKVTMDLRCSIRVCYRHGINVPSRMVFLRVLCTLYAVAFTAHFLQTPIFMAYI